ncbi:MAG: 3-phosphoshikimate 1-carboxyvinyltransferase [Halarsenatibacteraceae bacterium]
MKLQIENTSRIDAEVSVPGDKSISHRSLMLAGIANGQSRISGLLEGEDCLATLKIMEKLGVDITRDNSGTYLVEGKGLAGLKEPADILDCGNSGTSMRLLSGLLAGRPFYSVLTGDSSLNSRPMARIITPLTKMGAKIWSRDNGLAPLSIKGGKLTSINYDSPVASAQVKSSILLAGLSTEGITYVNEPAQSRDHTEKMLKAAGVDLEVTDNTIKLTSSGQPELDPLDIKIPGDISSTAFIIAAGLITDKSKILIKDVGINQTRTGILDALEMMGAELTIQNKRTSSGEPLADIQVFSSNLKAVEISGELVPRLIDEIPLLALLATQADGETVIKDAAELRVKETDRIKAISSELRKLGAEIEEYPDGMKIKGNTDLKGGIEVDSFGDHRIGMTMAIAGLVAKNGIIVNNSESINISFPDFEKLINNL